MYARGPMPTVTEPLSGALRTTTPDETRAIGAAIGRAAMRATVSGLDWPRRLGTSSPITIEK